MNGYTMIPVEELTMFGEVLWEENIRAIKLWLEGANVSNYLVKPMSYPTTTLYNKNGNTTVVYKGKEAPYIEQGWYRTRDEAQAARNAESNKKNVSKFKVGNRVWMTFIVINKYGVVTDINSSNGKVKVRWTKITDSYGNEQAGFNGMIYGLGTETWEDASSLMLQ